MKIALAQLNPVVGDFDHNVDRILGAAREAADRGADLVLFPELAVTGYPPRDLLDHGPFVDRNLAAVEQLVRELPIAGLVGHVARNPARTGKGLFNAASLIHDGRARTYHKMLLPTYDVFDEARYFEPGKQAAVFDLLGVRLGITVCEDIWNEADFLDRPYDIDPPSEVAAAGADLILSISASPWQLGKPSVRRALFGRQAAEAGIPLLCCNQVGGNDELIFDGNSMVFDAQGRLCHLSPTFRESLDIIDTDALPGPQELPQESEPSQLAAALQFGLVEYARKTGFDRFLVGLSGGIDSAVVAGLAIRTFGADAVKLVAMPSRFSSQGSVDDAIALADSFGATLTRLPIEDIYDSYLRTLADEFAELPFDVAEENIQARIRGGLLMAISNKKGHLLLTTGNKSELAVGYCTLYGDMCGGLAVISDVPKTLVYELANEINRQAGREMIPRSTIDKPPSAELRPDQLDQDSLPPYDVLDAILEAFLEDRLSLAEIVARGHDAETVRWVVTRVMRNEYKRWQAAPGLRVTSKAFGQGRRMPIAQGYSLD